MVKSSWVQRSWVALFLMVFVQCSLSAFADMRLPIQAVKRVEVIAKTAPQQNPNQLLQTICLPFRVITGAAGAGLGIVAGGLQGILETEQSFASQTFGKANENVAMIPVGIIGSALAVPVGFLLGAPEGAMEWANRGFNLWNHIG